MVGVGQCGINADFGFNEFGKTESLSDSSRRIIGRRPKITQFSNISGVSPKIRLLSFSKSV